jgi:phage I-like protein
MKHRTALPTLIRLSAGGEPPGEFRLFPMGTIETTKGTFYLDPDDAQACLEAQAAYGNDLSIDWGHGAFEEAEGKPQPAAGWIGGLELRGDGLWAVRVTWTETAAGMLKRREQRYFSPAFTTDKAGHIRSIINCALTLIPATHGLIPLVASRAGNRGVAARKLNNMADKYCKAAALLALADEMDGDEKASDEDKAMAAKLRKLAEDAEELKLAEGDDEPDGDEGEKASDDEPDGDEKKQASRIAKLAREVTGKRTPAEVEGVLLAYKEARGQVETLSKQVAELTRGNRAGEVADLISKASRAGKLAPAQKKWATDYGMKDLAGFKAYLDAAPVLVSMKDGRPVETASADPSSVPTELTTEQIAMFQKAGIDTSDPKALVSFLNRRAAGQLPKGTSHGTRIRSSHDQDVLARRPRAPLAAGQDRRSHLRGLARRAPGGLRQARRDRYGPDRRRARRGAGGQHRRLRRRPQRLCASRRLQVRQQRHQHRRR